MQKCKNVKISPGKGKIVFNAVNKYSFYVIQSMQKKEIKFYLVYYQFIIKKSSCNTVFDARFKFNWKWIGNKIENESYLSLINKIDLQAHVMGILDDFSWPR